MSKESTKIEWFGLKDPVDVVDAPKLFGVFGMKLQDVMESAMNWVSKFVFNSCDESCDYSQTRAPFFHTPFPGNEVSWV